MYYFNYFFILLHQVFKLIQIDSTHLSYLRSEKTPTKTQFSDDVQVIFNLIIHFYQT